MPRIPARPAAARIIGALLLAFVLLGGPRDGFPAAEAVAPADRPAYTQPVTVGVLRLTLRLPSRSLKEKRAIVRPIVERLRNRFNAAVAEVDRLDAAGEAVIAAAVLSNDQRHADEQLHAIVAAIRDWRLDAELLDLETELLDL